MQEIANQVYIETAYAGVTLGVINWSHGLILIDAPFRQEDARSWRSAQLNLGGGVDRLLVNLDAHFDRTLGVRAMECTVVGHEKIAEIFRNRPASLKTSSADTGADWELYNGQTGIRWLPPDITFTDRLLIHWNESPLILEHHPGPSGGAIWARMPDQRIAFVGDALTPEQPPFLASANLPAWIKSLKPLITSEYQDYLLVSGRDGLVAHQQVHRQIHLLEKILHMIERLAEQKAPADEIHPLVISLMMEYDIPPHRKIQYRNRLQYGLYQYYTRLHSSISEEIDE